jgi:ubiquinone biosynthesis protein COQ9
MWYEAGDRSADWNHYTKRGLLASVYSTTLLYWMSDGGDDEGDFPETWAFLDRRISDVLKIFTLPYQLKSKLSSLPKTFLSSAGYRPRY